MPVNGCTLLCNNVWIHTWLVREFGNQWDIMLKQISKEVMELNSLANWLIKVPDLPIRTITLCKQTAKVIYATMQISNRAIQPSPSVRWNLTLRIILDYSLCCRWREKVFELLVQLKSQDLVEENITRNHNWQVCISFRNRPIIIYKWWRCIFLITWIPISKGWFILNAKVDAKRIWRHQICGEWFAQVEMCWIFVNLRLPWTIVDINGIKVVNLFNFIT